MTDNTLAQVIAGLFALIAAAGGTLSIRRKYSGDARDRAKDLAEASIFDNSLAEAREDGKRWQASAEEAWTKATRFESENAVLRLRVEGLATEMRLQRRIMREHPAAGKVFDTQAAPLDLPQLDFPRLPPRD